VFEACLKAEEENVAKAFLLYSKHRETSQIVHVRGLVNEVKLPIVLTCAWFGVFSEKCSVISTVIQAASLSEAANKLQEVFPLTTA
jgi:hypothetical protein